MSDEQGAGPVPSPAAVPTPAALRPSADGRSPDGPSPATPSAAVPSAAVPPAAPAADTVEPPAAGSPATPVVPAVPTGPVPPVPPAEPDPTRWGRVDDDGTVWLRLDDGTERTVGSWQAGDAVEGLAHFARRFDDLRTEADLLVNRLRGGRGDPRATLRSAAALRERLDGAAVVGDVAALRARLDAVTAVAEFAQDQDRRAKAGARDEAVARKEAIIAEAEGLAEETSRWKHAGDRFSAMLDEWKAVKGIDRKTDDALWKRFAKARETFTRRRGAHFAELDRARTAARTRKEELVAEAETLADSTDWAPTASRYKELMAEWKAAGRTSKDADDALWARFRAAQDGFFTRRSAEFDARDAEFAGNARAKEALLVEAGRIDLSDVEAARAALRGIQDRWDAIGKVPRERVREFSARLKEAEDRVRGAVDRRWSSTGGETEARLGQFRERVASFEAQAEKARAAGDRRRTQEAERQAAQWREWLAAAERAAR